MYNYERKYINVLIDKISDTKLERSETSGTCSVKSAVQDFLNEIKKDNNAFSFWNDLTLQRKKNALSAFKIKQDCGVPEAIIDNTIFNSAKHGVLFTDAAIYVKGMIGDTSVIYLTDFTKAKIIKQRFLDMGMIKKNFDLSVDNKLFYDKRFSVSVCDGRLFLFQKLQKKLCLNTELNKEYTDYVNAKLRSLISQLKNVNERVLRNEYSIYDYCNDTLEFIYDFVSSIKSDETILESLTESINISKIMSLLNKSEYGSFDVSELMDGNPKLNEKDINELVCEIKQDYINDHYNASFNSAKDMMLNEKYHKALIFVKDAKKYRQTNECIFLEIKIYLLNSSEENWFNYKNIKKALQQVEAESLPADLKKEINLNNLKYKEYTDKIKCTLMTDTEKMPVSHFTSSGEFMIFQDDFGMTPAMYFVLYGRDFDTNALNSGYKEQFINCRNIFRHNILEIASLLPYSKYYLIRKISDDTFSEEEAEFARKNKQEKIVNNILSAGDTLFDFAKACAKKQADSLYAEGRDDEAAKADEISEQPNNFFENISRSSADEIKAEHDDALYSEYELMRENVINDIAIIKKNGTDYKELLQIYEKCIDENNENF